MLALFGCAVNRSTGARASRPPASGRRYADAPTVLFSRSAVRRLPPPSLSLSRNGRSALARAGVRPNRFWLPRVAAILL